MSVDVRMLELALGPALPQLLDPTTEELCFNRPGEAWWLRTGRDFERIEMPAMNYRRLHGIAVLAAAQARQTIGPRNTIMGGDIFLAGSELRIHAVIPPSVPAGTICLTLRRHGDSVYGLSEINTRYDTSRWNEWDCRKERKQAASGRLLALYDAGDLEGFLRAFATERRTPFFTGPTGAGKSTLLKVMLPILPMQARVLTVEDAREAVVPQPNHVRLLYSDGGLSGGATIMELMKASLRLRPDNIVLQEIRDPQAAWMFIREVLSGHPGSPTTIHGGNAVDAAKNLFNLVKSSNEGKAISDDTLITMLGGAVDCIVPVANDGGLRSIGEVWLKDHAARRGETFADLLREV